MRDEFARMNKIQRNDIIRQVKELNGVTIEQLTLAVVLILINSSDFAKEQGGTIYDAEHVFGCRNTASYGGRFRKCNYCFL